MAFLSQATSSWRLASSSRLPFRSMLLTLRGGPESLAPRAHQIPVSLMVFSTFLCRAFTAHRVIMILILFPSCMPLSLLPPEASRGLGYREHRQGGGLLLRHRRRRPGFGDEAAQRQRCV